MNEAQREFVTMLLEKFGQVSALSRKEICDVIAAKNVPFGSFKHILNPDNRVGRGLYKIPSLNEMPAMAADIVPINKRLAVKPSTNFDPNVVSEYEYASVPDRDPNYVAFGEYKMIERIISSAEFFPIFIAGHSGYGKTIMTEQACAKAKRKMIRVQMSRETDEDDLIGGFRLIDGETKFMKGPVLRAMEIGAVLLIDEADRADPGKVMCLQGILEGKPYYVKKTGEIITANSGFNIIVTANTKGRGSDDGRYVAASILDDAWLERFPITIKQEYPSVTVEKKILSSYLTEADMIDHLTNWSDIIRKTFDAGGLNDLISTRRLVHIAKTYNLVQNRTKAIELCINRFDEETKTAFLALYSKVDPTINPVPQAPEATTSENITINPDDSVNI